MKQRYNALDIQAAVVEISKEFESCRVVNVYDVDHKTYLIKLNKPDSKAVILIESGIRIHSTEFDLPKNLIPSGFSMKLRKHIRGRRLEKCTQVGSDRIVDLQFGSNEAAYHLIIELYDRGNILLTDFEYTIISVLRPRTDENTDVKFTVKEKYPLHLARNDQELNLERLNVIFANTKQNDEVKKVLTANLTFGGALIEHCLSVGGFGEGKCLVGKNFSVENDLEKLLLALKEGDNIVNDIRSGNTEGFIIQKQTKAPKLAKDNLMNIEEENVLIYDEFHPFLFNKFKSLPQIHFESFDKAVDEFFSKIESQKSEMKESQQNRDAVKKLDNVKKDHQARIEKLKNSQTEDEFKAQLIEYNLDLVDQSIFLVNSAIANQLDWKEIEEIISDAKEGDHPVALVIKDLNLDINHITLTLKNPDDDYDYDSAEDGEGEESQENKEDKKTYSVKIDLALNAYRNSRKYYDQKKSLFAKEKKTIDASGKALKSAEKRTLEILKQASKNKSITKARKPYWFEKFYWFISSENYLIVGGHDMQQNEIVVKRHLKAGDIYVHADLNGASSVIIKNPTGNAVPPKTLNEAGSMAVCYSVAWEAKVLANAYWVYHDQVSKQAPTGEYIGTGSFMIRGKKNFLPQTALVFGLALMYKLDDDSVVNHENDRKVKNLEEENLSEIQNEQIEFDEIPDEIEEGEEEGEGENEGIDNEIHKLNLNPADPIEEETEIAQQFPDTSFQLKMVSDLTKTVIVNADRSERGQNSTKKDDNEPNDGEDDDGEDDESSSEDEQETRVRQKDTKIGSSKVASSKKEEIPPVLQGGLKKGQKAKLNKIKKKYKDQDDEDKELVMQLLKSAGNDEKKTKKSDIRREKKDKKMANKVNQQHKAKHIISKADVFIKPINVPLVATQALPNPNQKSVKQVDAVAEAENVNPQNEEVDPEDGNEEFSEQQKQIDEALLNSLTGQPLDQDELLFTLTVCAPYNCITNYKHKVKLTPGTAKRGKAMKTAVEMFTRDKVTSVKERELIKTCLTKDMDGRNLPGKVKISAPNINKLKKK